MQKLALPLEVKSLDDRQFIGHGSVFGNVDLGDDVVLPGAFSKSLTEKSRSGVMPGLFWMHDPAKVAGKWHEMKEDKRGLWVRGELAPTPLGEEIHALMKMDAVSGLSIGFQIRDHDYDKDGIRLIKEVDLWEVSVVSLPMNPLARVTHVKTQTSESGEYVPTVREFERILRDVGCRKSVAKRIISKMFNEEEEAGGTPDLPRRDAGFADEAEMLNALADKIIADVIRLKIAA